MSKLKQVLESSNKYSNSNEIMAFVYRCNGVEIISVMVTAVLHHASVFIPCVIIVQILFSYRSDMTRILVCDCRNRLYPILEKLGLC